MNIPNPLNSAEVVEAFPEYDVDPVVLGDGGMKSAFKIYGDKPLVLKIVREPLTEDMPEGRVSVPERFQREIEGMRRINHPGIVPIIDGPSVRGIGGEQHIWYIEPFFEGGSLADWLTRPWPESKCLSLLIGLIDAIEVLAKHNVVHRDIKPSNIVFDPNGLPVLLDLGIAYFQDLTPLTDNLARSPRTDMYAAPEQFDMRRQIAIDFRTDLFLTGIVVFETLTTIHPFDPADYEGYHERLFSGNWSEKAKVALDDVGVSSGLNRILKRLLEPNINRRYRTFVHLRSALREL